MENSISSPITISLPPHMQDFVHAQVAAGAYRSASDYIEHLVETDQQQKLVEQFEGLILKGLNSGQKAPLDRAEWDSIRREIQERMQAEPKP